ncbi:MAG: T9SS type A sorting domain-containing protein [Saprospiraceae bacterium]
MLFVLGAISFATAQTIYWEETFNDGLPMDWSSDGDWTFGLPADVSSAYFAVPAGADGQVAVFNDDNLGQTAVGGGTITTSEIDLSAISGGNTFLVMDSYFPNLDYQGLDERAVVEISTDAGSTWTMVANFIGGQTDAFGNEFIVLNDYVGQSIWLRFMYDDGQQWNYGWAIDRVIITDEITFADQKDYSVHAGSSIMMDVAMEGIEYLNEGYVFNFGWEPITSFDVSMTDGTDTYMTSVSGVNIPYNGAGRYFMEDAVTVAGDKSWTVSISNVNGTMDTDTDVSDNEMSFNLNAINDAHPDKGVLYEEATGTWCQWCPRGTVFMDEVSKRLGKHFVGIAVHNGANDPMVLTEYDAEISSMVGGYPSGIYQRDEEIDPGAIAVPVLEDIQDAPPATLTVGAVQNGSELSTAITVNALEDFDEEHKVSIIIVENNMTEASHGTSLVGSWTQINTYSGGNNGLMGGFELLPGAVGGDLMIYNHVGRGLIGDFEGVEGIVPEDFATGEEVGYNFDAWDIPADLITDNMYIVGILMNDDDEVVNAISTPLDEALANGAFVSSNKEVFDNTLAEVRPTLVQDMTTVYMSLDQSADVSISLVNTVGQTVASQEYGNNVGKFQLDVDMNGLATGVYIMHIKAGDKFITKKVNKVN